MEIWFFVILAAALVFCLAGFITTLTSSDLAGIIPESASNMGTVQLFLVAGTVLLTGGGFIYGLCV